MDEEQGVHASSPQIRTANRPKRAWIRSGKKTHAVCYYHPELKRRRVAASFNSKTMAQKYLRQYQRWMNGLAEHPDQEAGFEPTQIIDDWDERVEEYLVGRFKHSTLRDYKSRLSMFRRQEGLPGAVQVMSPNQVTTPMIEKWLQARIAKGASLSTVGGDLRAVAAFLRWAKPDDHPITPALVKKWKPYAKRLRYDAHFYTEDDLQSLLQACNGVTGIHPLRDTRWWQAYILVLYYTGFRLNEVSHLTWQDVGWETECLSVQPTRSRKLLEWTPKGKHKRTVPIPPCVVDILSTLQARQEEGVPYIFLNADRYTQVMVGKKLKPGSDLLNMILPQFKEIRNRAGIKVGKIHDFRHTFVTRLLQNGIGVSEVRLLAGHQDIATTMRYAELLKQDDAIEKARKTMSQSDVVKRLIQRSTTSGE